MNLAFKIILSFSCIVLTLIGVSTIATAQSFPSQQTEALYLLLDENPEAVIDIVDSVLSEENALSATEIVYYLMAQSDAFFYSNNIVSSTYSLHKALQILPSNFEKAKLSELYNNMGQNLSVLSFPDSAIYYYKKGLIMAQSLNDSIQMSNLYYNIGIELMLNTDYSDCIPFLDSSYQIVLNMNDSLGISASLKAMGRLKSILYDFEGTIIQYKKALNYCTDANPNHPCMLYNGIGNCFLNMNRLDSAAYYASLAKQCFENQKNNTTIGYLYLLEANILDKKGLYQEAIAGYKKTMAFAKELGDVKLFFDAKIALIETDSIERTFENMEQLLRKDRLELYPEKLIFLYETYAQMLEKEGRFEEAATVLNILIKRTRNSLKDESKLQLQQQSVQFGLYQKENDLKLTKLNFELKEATWRNYLILAIVTAFVLIILYYLYAQRKILNKERERLKQEKELLERIMLVEGQALRAQMNPHFIFNALNSIKGLVVTQQNKEAALYISKFSKLVRNVLDNSRELFITLDKEINTLEIYMQLEQARFRDGFDYHIEWGDAVNSNILIPPAVLQPFVENSIWHGFKQNPRPNKIEILMHSKDGYLYIDIKDNGVGIQAGMDNKKVVKTRKSHGVDITKSRIEQYTINDKNGSLSYSHVGKEDKQPWGTIVSLRLPIQY